MDEGRFLSSKIRKIHGFKPALLPVGPVLDTQFEPSLQSCHGVADVDPPVIWISYPLVPYFRVWMDPAKAKLAGPYLLQVMESLHGR